MSQVHLGRFLDQELECPVFLHYQTNVEENRATLPFPLDVWELSVIMSETFSLRTFSNDVRLIISFYNKHFT